MLSWEGRILTGRGRIEKIEWGRLQRNGGIDFKWGARQRVGRNESRGADL